jgi:two-component system, NarL family, sensor histidine kinase DevS
VLDRLLGVAREVTGARYAAIGVLDERREALADLITAGIDPEARRTIGDLPHGRGVLGVLISDPRPLRLADVGSHPLGSFPYEVVAVLRSGSSCFWGGLVSEPG